MRATRRELLVAGGGSLAAGLAGCLGALPGRGGSGEASGLTLETIGVGSLDSETVPVQPAGEVTLLDFFATWCAPCKSQMATLGRIRERFPDVHMLSITWEGDTGAIRNFWKTYDGSWPVASDTEVETGRAYGIDNFPTLLVLDGSGERVYRHQGLASESAIADALARAGATPDD